MRTIRPRPNVDPESYAAERSAAARKWERLHNDKLTVLRHVTSLAGATITPHRLLILVDLQGLYLALQKWLAARQFPMEDGLIPSRFAHFQLEATAKEVARRLAHRLASSQGRPTLDLEDLFDAIKVGYADDKAFLAEQLNFLAGGAYLDVSMAFELFYAPVPLSDIEGDLWRFARRGSEAAKGQLLKVNSGVVEWKGAFARDYRVYDDFVARLKESTYHACSQQGFFSYSVGPQGLRYFDEKEVDIRIAIRAMDALHKGEADSICIVSSDQDFVPLHARAEAFGVSSFQADLAKFRQDDNVGRKLQGLKDGFIRGDIDPDWPLRILSEGLSMPQAGHFANYEFSEEEIQALCRLHDGLNETRVEVKVEPDGKAAIRLSRPHSAPPSDAGA